MSGKESIGNGNRHTKYSTRDAGIKNTKRPYDRSLNRQIDQKLQRKGNWSLNDPEQDQLAIYDVQSEIANDFNNHYDYIVDDDEAAALKEIEKMNDAEKQRKALSRKDFPAF